MSISKAVFLLLFSTLTACSWHPFSIVNKIDPNGSIIGGQKASSGDLATASTVSIMAVYGDELYSICTGTLISKDLVVTAAHCLMDGTDHLSIYFGEIVPSKTKDAKLIKIENSVSHPDYKIIFKEDDVLDTTVNDVALIKLAEDVPAFARPVAILDETVNISVGSEVLLAGYGLVNEIGEEKRAENLNFVKVPVAEILEFIIVTDQTNASGACNGDSGGPAYLETWKGLVLVGATRGPHDGALDCRHFGEYTNLTKFKSFISEYGQQLRAQAPVFTSDID
ncbi:MAG: S1 family peptidase [Bdellovibrio sp.]